MVEGYYNYSYKNEQYWKAPGSGGQDNVYTYTQSGYYLSNSEIVTGNIVTDSDYYYPSSNYTVPSHEQFSFKPTTFNMMLANSHHPYNQVGKVGLLTQRSCFLPGLFKAYMIVRT